MILDDKRQRKGVVKKILKETADLSWYELCDLAYALETKMQKMRLKINEERSSSGY